MISYRAVAKYDGKFWTVQVERPDGSLVGEFASAGLELVAAKARDLAVDPSADVTIDVVLPAATEQRLQHAEQLCEEAQRDLEAAIVEMRDDGNMSIADIGFVFALRRLRPEARTVPAAPCQPGHSPVLDAAGCEGSLL